MTNPRRIGRRHVLRGAGGVALGLPLLEAMAPALLFTPRTARAQPPPKRLVIVYSPNGFMLQGGPTGTETDFRMTGSMAPLDPHRDQLNVLTGIWARSGGARGGDGGHTHQICGMLTGAPMANDTSTNISIDQVVANKIHQGTKFKSYHFAAGSIVNNRWGWMCFRGPGDPIRSQHVPATAFKDLFSDASTSLSPADAAAFDRLREERRSVIDALKQDYTSFVSRLGAADRARMEQYTTSLREIELSLADLKPSSAGCQVPPDPGEIRPGGLSDAVNYPKVAEIMCNLLVMALACDRTRVATFQFEHSSENRRFAFAGADVEHHECAHGLQGTSADLGRINGWFAQKIAGILARMKMVNEGGSTLLDNSLLYWTSCMANGNHSEKGQGLILAGSAGGYFKTGRWLRYGDDPSRVNVLVSIQNAFGIPSTTFGAPGWSTGPLRGLH